MRYGALNFRRSAENLVEVERLVSRCRVQDITAATAAVYRRLRLRLRPVARPPDDTARDILATEIVADLEAALEQFREIAGDLAPDKADATN